MRRTLGANVLKRPVCRATMALLAILTRREGIDRILSHVEVPRGPGALPSEEPRENAGA